MPDTHGANRKPRVVYLIGTGRCGSTALAAILSLHSEIAWRGELIHLVTAVPGGSLCSCGREISQCDVWQKRGVRDELQPAMEYCHQFESHRSSPATLVNPSRIPADYGQKQAAVFESLCDDGRILLDSSKYVGRALALANSDTVDARFIYMVRDPRGVAFSFSKNVQSGRSTLSACMYYMVVNTVAEISTRWRLRGRVVKLRYEDFLDDPQKAINRIGALLDIDMGELANEMGRDDVLQAEHVAGGNRWVRSGAGQLRQDVAWKSELSSARKLLIHVLCFPLQFINRYRL